MRRLAFLVCALAFCAACSEPPQKEIDTAQRAIDAARAAGAEQYAKDAYTAATAALQTARAAAAQGDYRLALSRALDARERAQDAAKATADAKGRERTGAERAVTDATNALQELQQKIKTAATAGVPPRDLKPVQTAAESAAASLQKARAAMSQGKWNQAEAAVAAVAEDIAAKSRALDDQINARAGKTTKRRR
jgi:hypothetical protein